MLIYKEQSNRYTDLMTGTLICEPGEPKDLTTYLPDLPTLTNINTINVYSKTTAS